jgi:hypothetical protein
VKTKKYIAGSILFLVIMACGVPSLSQPSVSPTFDADALSTLVGLTANAATTQTAVAAQPVESTPSLPETAVTTIEQLPDGSTKYTDYEVGIEIVFPTGWLTLRANSDEFNAALKKEAVKNDLVRSQMELDLAEYEPGAHRLYSYPLRPDIEKNIAFGFSKLKWDSSDSTPINENSMGGLIRDFESSGAIPGFRVDTAQIYDNVNQVKLIEIGGQFSFSNAQGDITPFYMTAVFFKPTSDSTVRISFVYWKDYKLQLYEDVTSVINSIKLISQ